MKHLVRILFLVACLLSYSCDDDLEQDNDAYTNFESLWSIIDERYCFFEFKKDSILDWNQVHDIYLDSLAMCKTSGDVFYVFSSMLNQLKDGHVNLTSSFDHSHYDLQGEYDDNFISNVLFSSNYLGKDYHRAGGLYYKLLAKRNIGYIYYPSFSNAFSASNLNSVLTYFKNTDGLIIDIRGNGGGYLSYVEPFASRFAKSRTLVGFFQHKTGKAHDAFSTPKALYVEPSSNVNYQDKPVVLLTNREVFSSANYFTQVMKAFDNVTVIGDVTGGGCGVPVGNELPCGWILRYSSSVYLDRDSVCTEWGIKPDVFVSLDKQKAYLDDVDTIIEYACDFIKNKK